MSADGPDAGISPIEQLLASAQDKQDATTQQLSQDLDQWRASNLSTEYMLRLQFHLNAFGTNAVFAVHVAVDFVGGIKTLLTQQN